MTVLAGADGGPLAIRHDSEPFPAKVEVFNNVPFVLSLFSIICLFPYLVFN